MDSLTEVLQWTSALLDVEERLQRMSCETRELQWAGVAVDWEQIDNDERPFACFCTPRPPFELADSKLVQRYLYEKFKVRGDRPVRIEDILFALQRDQPELAEKLNVHSVADLSVFLIGECNYFLAGTVTEYNERLEHVFVFVPACDWLNALGSPFTHEEQRRITDLLEITSLGDL